MKKRLRKKKHLGEFQELCFEIEGSLRPELSRDEVYAVADRFIAAIEARQLGFSGGIGTTISGFITRLGRGSATADDRASVSEFLSGDPDVERHQVGELRDAWHE